MASKEGSLAAMADMDALLRRSCRGRERCIYETCFSHDNLAAWLESHVLPSGWDVVRPPAGSMGPGQHWPEDTGPEAQDLLRDLFAKTHQVPDAASLSGDGLERLMNGHCETVAVALTREVLSQLSGGAEPAAALRQAYGGIAKELTAAPEKRERLVQQMKTLFEAEGRGRKAAAGAAAGAASSSSSSNSNSSSNSSGYERQIEMWRPLVGLGSDVWGSRDGVGKHDYLAAFCAGFPVEAITEIARKIDGASSPPSVAALPLYILNYIWDGDELTAEQLSEGTAETAQFSLHVVGLVLVKGTAIICDPNGPINATVEMPPSCEFLELPFRSLPAGVVPSTSNARFDREQRRIFEEQEAAKKSTKKKKKASGGGGGAAGQKRKAGGGGKGGTGSSKKKAS